MTPEFIYQVLVLLFVSGAVYGGIRVDLKSMNEKIKGAHDAAMRAHERLDIHIDRKGDK